MDSRGTVVAFGNKKGGAGKTSATGNSAVALAKRGYKVLVIDTDPQSNLTKMMCIDEARVSGSLGDALFYPPRVPVFDLPIEAPFPLPKGSGELWVIPSREVALTEGIMNITREMGGDRYLAKNLDPLREVFDWILVDTRPNREVVTHSAIMFADYVVGTLFAESRWNLEHAMDTELMTSHIRELQLGHARFAGLLFTKYDKRLNDCKANLRNAKSLGIPVCPTVIPDRNAATSSEELSVPPVGVRKPNHPISEAYDDVAEWLVSIRDADTRAFSVAETAVNA